MKKPILGIMAILAGSAAAFADGDVIVSTDAYTWKGDTLYQDEFKAWAVNPYEVRSTYKGRPGYFMPIEQTWTRKNDLSAYPRLSGGNPLMEALYNMSLDEMVNAVEPDTTLRTGKEWAGVWTRDVSYSIILSMAALQPEASMVSLLKKINPEGQIIQDTGSGGAWPISTDRMVWTIAAWEIYKVTGDKKWLETVFPVVENSIAKDDATIYSENGLVKGETSFIDWREQSYPKWMQTVDISQSEAMGTNVMYAAALKCASEMAEVLGKKKVAAEYAKKSEELAAAIDKTFWMPDKGYYGMYTYGRDNKILNPRAETLGESLSILYDIVPEDRQKSISENNPVTKFGAPVFYPQISDMPNYHNNALWPWVAAYWTLAQAKAGNEAGVVEGIGSIVRPAALFTTNKENLNLDNGDIFTELNSSNMLWCLAGQLALTNQLLFGIHFEKDGLRIEPFVPQAFGGNRTLSNFPYRGARLNITVKGYGDRVNGITVNGKSYYPEKGKVIPAKLLKDGGDIVVEMNNQPISPMKLNRVANLKAPITPITWLSFDESVNTPGVPVNNLLQWNPIEYIGEYIVLRDGKEVARTRQTSYPAIEEGEWQVIGVAGDGTHSFASEPRSNRTSRFWEMKDEKTSMSSSEVSYQPQKPIEGYRGNGFAETDMKSGAVTATFENKAQIMPEGEYVISFRYANGNGPVNTENKAAIRSLYVDGVDVGTIVLPQRGVGNWNDWGMSNGVRVHLAPGNHEVKLVYNPEDQNMNLSTNHALIDGVLIEKAGN
ncbi:MAG: glycogen debranching protein [Bacteroides sp.]|nr:glycogen debranching protein [Bacteroides sp.]